MAGYIGAISTNTPVVTEVFSELFEATEGQTTFIASRAFSPKGIDIYVNGIKVVNGVDVSDGLTIKFSQELVAGDEIEVTYHNLFKVADTYNKEYLNQFMVNVLKAVTDNANNHLKLKLELMQKGVI